MKAQRILLVLPLVLLGACSQPAESPTAPENQAAADEPLLAPEDAAIPTEAEAADQAAKAIDDANADAELEKLKQELGGGK